MLIETEGELLPSFPVMKGFLFGPIGSLARFQVPARKMDGVKILWLDLFHHFWGEFRPPTPPPIMFFAIKPTNLFHTTLSPTNINSESGPTTSNQHVRLNKHAAYSRPVQPAPCLGETTEGWDHQKLRDLLALYGGFQK